MNVMNDIKLGYGWVRQSYDLFLHHPAKWLFLSFLYLFVFILMPMLLLGTIGFFSQPARICFITDCDQLAWFGFFI